MMRAHLIVLFGCVIVINISIRPMYISLMAIVSVQIVFFILFKFIVYSRIFFRPARASKTGKSKRISRHPKSNKVEPDSS